MKSYKKENLQQCVRNLFSQAHYEFRVIHNIECTFRIAVGDGLTKFKVISYWNNENDCFYGTALELCRVRYDSKILVNLYAYVKYSDYTCSYVVGACETPEDVFEWLENPESLQKCLDKIDELIENID